jgi:RNA recognition motif-containing protein
MLMATWICTRMTLPIAPSQTLYLCNLDDRISVNELKRELYCLFSFAAPVVEIEARKGLKTRGQAWVSFATIQTANIAMQRLQGFNFFGRELVIEFAKRRSKSVIGYDEWKALGDTQVQPPEPEPEPIRESPVLSVTGYPPNANAIVLGVLFRTVPGYQKIEMHGETAAVYFADAANAAEALTKLQNFPVTPTCKLSIQYAT